MSIPKVLAAFSLVTMSLVVAQVPVSCGSLASPPPLPEEEVDAIRQLSRSELVELIESVDPAEPGDVWRLHHALVELSGDGYSITELERLVEVAKGNFRFGMTIVGHLAWTIYDGAPSEEERLKVDRFVDLMEALLEEDRPKSPAGFLAVEGLARVIYISTDTPSERRKNVEELNVPYAYDRVVPILIGCINSENPLVRTTATRWLGTLVSHDLETAERLITLLEAQRESLLGEEPEDHEARVRREELLVPLDAAIIALRISIDAAIKQQQSSGSAASPDEPPKVGHQGGIFVPPKGDLAEPTSAAPSILEPNDTP